MLTPVKMFIELFPMHECTLQRNAGCAALLHKSARGQISPNPRRGYATATVWGQPSSVNRFSMATRTCSSLTWRSNVLDITRSPSRLIQYILVSTKLRR